MKGAVFAILVLSLLLGLMLLITPSLNPASQPLPAGPGKAASAPAGPPATGRGLAAARPSPPVPSALQADVTLAERIEQWMEPLQRRLNPAPESERDEAARHLQAGRYARAARSFDRLLTREPDDPELLRGAATALYRLKRYEDALPWLRRVIELDPQDTAARFQSAVTLTRLGRNGEALTALHDLLKVAPDHDRARFALAVLQQAAGQKAEALRFWQARRLDAHLPAARPAADLRALDDESIGEAFFHRGEVAMDLRFIGEAADCFEQAARRRPGDASAWCNLGIARAVLAREQEAIAALEQALRIKPDLVPALNQLAFVYAQRFRTSADPQDGERILELCARSLATQSYQPDIIQLRSAVIGTQRPDTRTAPALDEAK